ncbi:MAG: hypothetical protein II738_03430, partial [Clostridia bacterium]|nr:hypothetical protein [Clostridia bacterium]
MAAIAIFPFAFSWAADEPPLPEEPAMTVPIASSEALIAYSREYARGGHNPNDVIQLALSSGTSFVLPSGDDGYIPIGNASRPFNGTIEIADNAVNSVISDLPFFGTVTTDAVIENASHTTRELQMARLSEADSPLFAASVVKGENNTGVIWKIKLVADERDAVNKTAYSFAGAIGSVADDCVLDFEFTHDSVSYLSVPANASSAGNIGLICGTLGENAVLRVKISSSNSFSIISTGGHAGGVVGVMESGSTLIFLDDYSSPASVSSAPGKYAGALVGYAENAVINVESGRTVNLSETVTGGLGAGGLYGFYASNDGDRVFDLGFFTSDDGFTIAGGTHCGLAAGRLEATANVEMTDSSAVLTDSTYPKQIRFTGGGERGGLVGKYQNNSLENIFYLHDAEVRIVANSGTQNLTGGAIGFFETGAAYAKIENFRLDAVASVSGGLVGRTNSNGSFIDVAGSIDINGSVGSGLIDTHNSGVLRLAGVTDLSDASYSKAQLVGTRTNALVYALGSGSDSTWTFKRGSGSVDDLADWGEVLRLSSANGLSESDFFTVDMTAHTVTVTGHVQNMATVKDFIKTALNMQLNDEDRGSLLFNSTTRKTAILAADLSITADIDLGGTGVSEFTRDNGDDVYTGNFDGNSHTITLAIGEPYGVKNNSPLAAPGNVGNNNYGTIIDHHYLGLFGKMSNNAVSDLNLDGFISVWVSKKDASYNVGGVAGSVSGTGSPLTLSGINTAESIHTYSSAAGNLYCGGAVGLIETGTSGTIAVSDCTFANAITEKTTASHGDYIGGAIGCVNSIANLTLDFDGITLAGTYSDAVSGSSYYSGLHYGGLVGFISANSSGNFTRNVTINDLTVADGTSITVKANGSDRTASAGGFLGNEWHDTNVTIGTEGASDGVTIGGTGAGTAPAITVSTSDGSHPTVSALVSKATGHWTVNHVKVNRANIDTSATARFGFIVGDGIRHSNNDVASALYLDLVSDGYDIAATAASGTFNVYDEIVGYSTAIGKTIEENGQAVVSVRTAGGAPLVMNGSACNTYQNQTSYGKNAKTTNENTRYYYNLDLIRGKASNTDAEKLLLWSLNKYAASKIRSNGYFNSGYNNTISGNCDMAGLSYYPVDASGVKINNASIKFYNDEIENGESGTGDSDGVSRSTRNSNPRTQHYMMHEGLFRNYSGTMTVN